MRGTLTPTDRIRPAKDFTLTGGYTRTNDFTRGNDFTLIGDFLRTNDFTLIGGYTRTIDFTRTVGFIPAGRRLLAAGPQPVQPPIGQGGEGQPYTYQGENPSQKRYFSDQSQKMDYFWIKLGITF